MNKEKENHNLLINFVSHIQNINGADGAISIKLFDKFQPLRFLYFSALFSAKKFDVSSAWIDGEKQS